MNLAALLEIAIGLAFVWIGLSLCTVALQPWISRRFFNRPIYLRSLIHELLANPNLSSQLYEHPFLPRRRQRRSPSRPAWLYKLPFVRGISRGRRYAPSYISAEQFAIALFDIIMTASTESSLIQQGILKIRDDLESTRRKNEDPLAIEKLDALAQSAHLAAATEAGTAITKWNLKLLQEEVKRFSKEHPEYKMYMHAVLQTAKCYKDEIDKVLAIQPNGATPSLSKLRNGIAAISILSPELHGTLTALLQNIEEHTPKDDTPLNFAQKKVEKWFNDYMEGLKVYLIRQSQMFALIIGLVISLLLNIDSINLAVYLWRDAAVREILVQNASNLGSSSQDTQAIEEFQKQFAGVNLPLGWVIAETQGPAFKNEKCRLFPNQDQKFGIPILATNKCIVSPQSGTQTNIVLKFIGILVSAAAAYQGAPFWFELMKSLIVLRGPHEPGENGNK